MNSFDRGFEFDSCRVILACRYPNQDHYPPCPKATARCFVAVRFLKVEMCNKLMMYDDDDDYYYLYLYYNYY